MQKAVDMCTFFPVYLQMSSDTLHACEVIQINQPNRRKGKYAYLLPAMAETGINTGRPF